MNAQELGNLLRNAFGDRAQVSVRSPKRLTAALAPADLPEVARWLRRTLAGCRLATATGIDLRDGVGVFHHFAVNGSPLVVTLKVIAPRPAPTVPSLAPQTSAADWIEREIRDLLGVTFEGHPDPRRLVKDESMSAEFPLRRGFDPAEFKEKIGERPEF